MARKIVFKNFEYRFIAILVFAICSLVFWNLNEKSIPSRYLIYLQPEPKTIFQDRDLSTYDFGGQIVDCFNNFNISAQKCHLSEKQAREFIYKHWQNKKRAYIILECNNHYCPEYYVFIEPDKNGNWRIIWRSKFADFERGFSSNISNEEMISVVYEIAKDDSQGFVTGTKYLSFLDKEGKEIHLF